METNQLLGQLFAMRPYRLCIDINMHRRLRIPLEDYLTSSSVGLREMKTLVSSGQCAMVSVQWLDAEGELEEYEVWATTIGKALGIAVAHLGCFGIEATADIPSSAGGLLESLTHRCQRGLSVCRWDFGRVDTERKWLVLNEYYHNTDVPADLRLMGEVADSDCLVDVDLGAVSGVPVGVRLGYDLEQVLRAV